jgi:ferritin-like metal-binding protein YciE
VPRRVSSTTSVCYALDQQRIDAGIIVAAQKVEHYEIASYGSVRTFAQLLGKDRSAELLQSTLDEESEANELLNAFAESGIANADFNRLHQQTPAGLRGSVRLRSAQFVLPRGAVTL